MSSYAQLMYEIGTPLLVVTPATLVPYSWHMRGVRSDSQITLRLLFATRKSRNARTLIRNTYIFLEDPLLFLSTLSTSLLLLVTRSDCQHLANVFILHKNPLRVAKSHYALLRIATNALGTRQEFKKSQRFWTKFWNFQNIRSAPGVQIKYREYIGLWRILSGVGAECLKNSDSW